MATVTGTVEAYSNKWDKDSILVNGKWYSTKFPLPTKPDKGDEVEFEDGGKNFINKFRITHSTGGGGSTASAPATRAVGFPVGVDTKDRSIVRQNSLGHAVHLVSTFIELEALSSETWEEKEQMLESHANLCVSVARIFESYSAGDGDMEEATKALEE